MFNNRDKVTEYELADSLKDLLNRVRDQNAEIIYTTLYADKWEGAGPYSQTLNIPELNYNSVGAIGLLTSSMSLEDARIATDAYLDLMDQRENTLVISAHVLPIIDIPVFIIFGSVVLPPYDGTIGEGFTGNALTLGGHPSEYFAVKDQVPSLTEFNTLSDKVTHIEESGTGGTGTSNIKTYSIILDTIGWDSTTKSISYQIAGLLANHVLMVLLDPSADERQKTEFARCGIAGTSQRDGAIVFTAKYTIPTIQIPVKVICLGVEEIG